MKSAIHLYEGIQVGNSTGSSVMQTVTLSRCDVTSGRGRYLFSIPSWAMTIRQCFR